MKFKVGDRVLTNIDGIEYEAVISDIDLNDKNILVYSQDAADNLYGHGDAPESTNGRGSWNCFPEDVTLINGSPIRQIKVVQR